MAWLATFGDEAETWGFHRATVKDLAEVAREFEARAVRFGRSAERDRQLAADSGFASYEAFARLDELQAATYRRVARQARIAAVRWRRQPWVTPVHLAREAELVRAEAPAVADMLRWLDAAAERAARAVDLLPLAHGPPPRALTEDHSPNVGVPAPPAAVATGERGSSTM